MRLNVDSNGKLDRSELAFTRGDDLSLELVFWDEQGLACTPPWECVRFGGKAPGDYSGDFLIYADEFLRSEVDDRPCFTGRLNLNGSGLSALVGQSSGVLLMAEIEFAGVNRKSSSQRLVVRIDNDIIKGAEGMPSGTTPDYATKGYVDGVVEAEVGVAMDERVTAIESSAERAETAKASAVEAESASNTHAGNALTSANAASGSAQSAAGSAGLAGEHAKAAAGSAATATEAVSTIGAAVTAAEGAASRAKTSETSAAGSATTATNAVNSIGNSVSTAQTAASAAAGSAGDANKSATTAGTKAGEANTSAIAAAKALEDAGKLLQNVVKSLGGKSGEILLGEGLKLTVDESGKASLSVGKQMSLTVNKDFSVTRDHEGILEGRNVLAFRGNIGTPSIDTYATLNVFGSQYITQDCYLYRPARVLRAGGFWDSYVTSNNLPQTINSAWSFQGTVVFNGDATRPTKAAPADMDVMNKAMTDAAIAAAGGGGGGGTANLTANSLTLGIGARAVTLTRPSGNWEPSPVTMNIEGYRVDGAERLSLRGGSGEVEINIYGLSVFYVVAEWIQARQFIQCDGVFTANGAAILNGEVTRQTKASPAETDVMNLKMVVNYLKSKGLIS